MKTCQRCGKEFDSAKSQMVRYAEARHCDDCMCRNFYDALDLPTPPDMLDKHTIKPTLSEREFRKELHK